MAVLQSTSITGGLTMHGMSVGFMRLNAQGAVVMDTNTYLTGITSGQVTTALGYTPYNSSNPSGYITSAALSSYLPLSGGTLTGALIGTSAGFTGNVTWQGINNGNPRSLAIGYSGGNYGQAGYGISYTSTGAHNYAINDIVSMWEAYDGIRVFAAGGGTVGTAISWTTVLDARRSTFSWMGNTVLHAGNYSSYALPLSGGNVTGRIEFQYSTDIYSQAWRNNTTGAYWWVTTASDRLGFHRNGDGDKFYFSNGGDFWSSTNGWLSTALSAKLSLSGGTMSGVLYFTDTTNGIYKSGGRLTVRSESTDNVANFASYGLYLPVTGQTAGLYVESPIEARGGLRIGSGASSGTINVGADTGVVGSRLVQRDANGYIYANHVNFSTPESENPAISSFITSNGDGWSRKSSIQHVRNQLGNYGGWITGYTETDTLATVMARGASTSSGITFTASGGTILLKHAVSEVDAWIFQENAANWGIYWKNAPSGHHTFGGYTTVGAETFGMSAANASGNGVSTTNFVGATSAIAQWMLSNYTGYIWSASTVFAAGDMRAPIFYDSQDTGYYADFNSTSNSAMRVRGGTLYGPNPTWGAYLQVGGNGWGGSYASVVATNGNLHLDSAPGYSMYLNNYANGVIYFNGGSYYISSNGSYYNGRSEQVTINYNNDSNSTYQLLWGSGNNVYGTSQVYVNPSSDIIYARGGYISPGNAWGTGDSAFFPNGITTAGGTNWVYGLTYLGNAPANGSGAEVRANGSSYFRSSNTSGSWGFAGQFVDRSNAANNYIPWSFENEYGNHSWGIVARFHIQQASADRPSIQFTSAGGNDRWSLGYCTGSDWNFRITQNQGFRTDGSGNSDGWGTERFRINTDGNTLIFASLGIGGVTPDARLSVNGDAHVSGIMYMGGTAGSVGSWGTRTTGYGGDWTTNARTVRFDNVGYGNNWSLTIDTAGNVQSSASMRAPIFYDSQDTGYYLDPNGTSNLQTWTVDTASRLGRSRYWTNRWAIYGVANDHMTGTNGWGMDHGGWDQAWKGGFSGWDIWGGSTGHPQGSGYIHAQGIISGQHAAASDGSTAYGWMMVGAHNATENRYWLRGKWGSSTSGWVEMISSGNIGSQSVSYANTAGRAYPRRSDGADINFYWSGQSGQPTWLWGSNDGQNFYVWNPSNFSVSYANSAGSVAWGNVSSKPSLIMYYQGFTLDANTMDGNSSGFTYSVNAPYTGPIVRFSETGYSLQLNAAYGGSGNLIAFRTRNGDNGTWNPWREIITTGNVGNQSVSYANNAGNVSSISGALNGVHTWTNLNYFRSNRNTSSDSPPLQAFSDNGSGAIMSFHRGGYYAVNFGLDSDNVMRIGGWSAAGNRWQLDMSGNMTVAGDVTAYSDARVKENVHTVQNALDKTLRMRGVTYNRTDSDDKKTKVGVIAQEMLEVLPEVVNQDNAGMYNVSYGNIVGVLIEAIKEQQQQIEDLKSKLDAVTK